MVIIGLKKAVEHARKELMTKLLNVPPTRTTTSSASFSTGETSSSTVRTCMSAALRQDYERLRSLRSMVFESTANRETPKSRTGPHEDLFTRDFENFARSMNRANKPTCETVVTPDAETCEAGSGEHPPQSPQQGRPVSCARPETNDKSTQICGQFFNCDGLHYAVALAEAQIKLRDAQQWVEHLERRALSAHNGQPTRRPHAATRLDAKAASRQTSRFRAIRPVALLINLVSLKIITSMAYKFKAMFSENVSKAPASKVKWVTSSRLQLTLLSNESIKPVA
ncbi:unnamed protein product [Caenorhabditis auriculariae]|uniref:Uncharacterized protein n=1 Tax=Caenorhabditis auriculariae TaxID=2777116 RepID=A0A8S1GZF3_9PELO|nr:unnamed protein product [Caenorhabditis auriculariae]